MSTPIIPNSFLFRYSIRSPFVPKIPSTGAHIVSLPKSATVPFFGAMDGQPEFADISIGWNENGIGITFEVRGKALPIYGEPNKPKTCDGMTLWIDTRDNRTIHRANRFCQKFYLLAHDGSEDAKPAALFDSVRRALEEPPNPDVSSIRIVRFGIDEDGDYVASSSALERVEKSLSRENTPKGIAKKSRASDKQVKDYRIEAFLPASVLHGFDPETSKRLGIFFRIRDREHGDQLLTGARELPYWEDPSLWSTLVLDR